MGGGRARTEAETDGGLWEEMETNLNNSEAEAEARGNMLCLWGKIIQPHLAHDHAGGSKAGFSKKDTRPPTDLIQTCSVSAATSPHAATATPLNHPDPHPIGHPQ